MKYKLKKDLPFAKAGAEVQIDEDLIFVETDPELYREVDFRSIAYSKDKDRLISEGWIEEVKPREFYISKTVLRDYGGQDPKDFFFPQRSDLIKVREVIE